MITVDFKLIKNIRLHINRTEKQAELLSERKKWMQLTSALNTLEDTSWAVEFYISTDYPDNMKGKYLYTYGLLQALFVQMDAVKSIHYSLFNTNLLFSPDYPEALKVREMRNDVTGHPTNRKGNQFIHLAQCSMKKNGFYYVKYSSNEDLKGTDIIDVDIFKAIENVAKCVNETLAKAVDALNIEFIEYINAHKERKMREIFNLLSYAEEKALLDEPMAEWGYKDTKYMVERCEDELKMRYGSIDANDSYRYLLEEIHELYDLIDNEVPQIPVGIRKQSKKYFLQCLFSKLEELKNYCEETDRYFENYGRDSFEDSTENLVIFCGENELED